MNDDPRQGKVSASRFEILALCPGSEQLRRTLPAEALVSGDEYTESGDRIHKARQTGNTFALEQAELDIYNKGMETEARILAQWRQDFNITEYEEGERELRLYLNDPSTMRIVASGQLDVHYVAIGKPFVLIVDWKALWSPHLTPAERNYQGRLQSVLAAKEYDAKHVRMSFNKAMFGRDDTADYNDMALMFAETSIHRAIWESEQVGAQRRPGNHCRYCPCKPYCEDAARFALMPTTLVQPGQEFTKESIEQIMSLMPLESAKVVWQKSGIVEGILAAIESRLKKLPPEELERLGLQLKEGRKLDRIADKIGAFNALRTAGFGTEEILKCLEFGKGKIVEMLQEKSALKKTEAEAQYDKNLGEFIERGQAKPSLVEVR